MQISTTHSATGYRLPATGSSQRGITLIDTLVGISLMLVIFIGIVGAFRLAVEVVTNSKARAGAVALADQRMEYIRSLSYASVGTVGGIPPGLIPESETLSLNGITYTRRTVIEYEDDPADGLGSSDTNGITEDYKAVKVEVSWTNTSGTRDVSFVTRVSPTNGLETNVSGGTLLITAINAQSAPLPGASVSIVNSSITPAVSINTFTNASGTVTILGVAAGTGYQITVSEPGYSTAGTYNATSQNTDPNPGDLTISNNNTTSATFAIDALGSKTIDTFAWSNGQTTTPIPNVGFTLQGTKTIGTGPSGTIYKYSDTLSSGASGSISVPNLEWDNYTVSINGASTGYDIASACDPQPESLAPGASMTSNFYLAPHTANSLLVDVRSAASGALIPSASVNLSRTGFSANSTTDPCGQSFFSGLTSSSAYSVSVSATGYATDTSSSVEVSGTSRFSVSLN